MKRRDLLCVVAAGTVGGLAGCVADSEPSDDGDAGGDDDTTTRAPPTLVGGDLTSVETDCADGDGGSYDAGADALTVTVAVSAEDGVCATCTGVLEYEATVDFDGGLPGTVRVRHADGDRTETVTTVSRS
ncbi:hypothetical protein BRD18_06600 [Halobacteriales archaeon SW_7_71_33]|nr:MAG: hypothetical protein BRD18_06600 [Halobacteriales archaeon SW_7_71_33]